MGTNKCPNCPDKPGWIYIHYGPESKWEKCERCGDKMVDKIKKIEVDLELVKKFDEETDRVLIFGFLQSFLNKLESNIQTKSSLKKDDGWFQCPFGEMVQEIGISSHKIRSAIKFLSSNGYIGYENRGYPKTQWIKINLKTK